MIIILSNQTSLSQSLQSLLSRITEPENIQVGQGAEALEHEEISLVIIDYGFSLTGLKQAIDHLQCPILNLETSFKGAFFPSQFLMKVHALLNPHKKIQPLIDLGDFEFHQTDFILKDKNSGEDIILTEKERNILLYIYEHKDGAVSRQDLLDNVWGYGANIETHTLETHIYRLRQKIEADPSQPQFLVTNEEGYSLNI